MHFEQWYIFDCNVLLKYESGSTQLTMIHRWDIKWGDPQTERLPNFCGIKLLGKKSLG